VAWYSDSSTVAIASANNPGPQLAASTSCSDIASDISVPQHMAIWHYCASERRDVVKKSFNVSGQTTWNTLPLTMCDLSLTLTQFCALLKTMLFCRAYETLPKRLRDSLGCKDRCANTMYFLSYLLTHLLMALHGARCNWNTLSACPGFKPEMFRRRSE